MTYNVCKLCVSLISDILNFCLSMSTSIICFIAESKLLCIDLSIDWKWSHSQIHMFTNRVVLCMLCMLLYNHIKSDWASLYRNIHYVLMIRGSVILEIKTTWICNLLCTSTFSLEAIVGQKYFRQENVPLYLKNTLKGFHYLFHKKVFPSIDYTILEIRIPFKFDTDHNWQFIFTTAILYNYLNCEYYHHHVTIIIIGKTFSNFMV